MMDKWNQLRHELGWQGISGIVLIVVGLMLSNAVLTPVEERAAEAREQVAAQDTRTSLGAEMQRQVNNSPAAMLEKFYDFFSSNQETTDYLAKIYSLAQANGLVLNKGDYKVTRNQGERITQYQISLPLTGGYNPIRSFTADVLDEIPTLSLDQIRFERKQANDTTVEAEVIFTLYRSNHEKNTQE